MTIKIKYTDPNRTIKLQNEKKRSERRKHCALAVVKRSQKFSPHRRPPSLGERDGQNLISWRWPLPLPTNRVRWGSVHAISGCRANRPTHTHTHTHTHTRRQDRLQHTAPQLARSVTRQQLSKLQTLLVRDKCSRPSYSRRNVRLPFDCYTTMTVACLPVVAAAINN